MSNGNWLKLNRELFDKPIWLNSTAEQKVVLIAILGMVNHTPTEWEWKGEKYSCEPGQKITSLPKIVEQCGKGITIQNVRTALKRFEKLGFLTDESTEQGRLITVVNWGKYQHESCEPNRQTNRQPTDDQQTANRQLTSNKNNKNNKNDKNEEENYIHSRATRDIIQHLNGRIGANYKPTTKKTKDLIQARMNEGFTVEDFKTVIDKKCVEWMNTDMQKFLRPETLFGTKFESYLNAPVIQKQEGSLWERIARGDFDE
jgi:uncharacterized phage protein (TIGR02220 family)